MTGQNTFLGADEVWVFYKHHYSGLEYQIIREPELLISTLMNYDYPIKGYCSDDYDGRTIESVLSKNDFSWSDYGFIRTTMKQLKKNPHDLFKDYININTSSVFGFQIERSDYIASHYYIERLEPKIRQIRREHILKTLDIF